MPQVRVQVQEQVLLVQELVLLEQEREQELVLLEQVREQERKQVQVQVRELLPRA